jgi:hypothetical protein
VKIVASLEDDTLATFVCRGCGAVRLAYHPTPRRRRKRQQTDVLTLDSDQMHVGPVGGDENAKVYSPDLEFLAAIRRALDELPSGVSVEEVEAWCCSRASGAAQRNKERGLDCDVDKWHMLEVLRRLRLRCDFSGVLLELRPHSEWLASIERPDPDQQYSQRNLTVILHALNTSRGLNGRGGDLGNVGCNWNAAKVQAVRQLQCQPIDTAALDAMLDALLDYVPALVLDVDALLDDTPAPVLDAFCAWCQRPCSRGELYPAEGTAHCRRCRRAFLQSIVPHGHTLERVIEQIRRQRGRCAHSGVSLSLVMGTSWMCVVSYRIDAPQLTDETLEIICGEFRTKHGFWTPSRLARVFGTPEPDASDAALPATE